MKTFDLDKENNSKSITKVFQVTMLLFPLLLVSNSHLEEYVKYTTDGCV